MYRNFRALLAKEFLARGIRFLYLVVIARILAPAEVGAYLYGIALVLSSLGIAGMGQGIVLSVRLGRGRAPSRQLIAHSLSLRLAAAAAMATIVVAFVWLTEASGDVARALTWLLLAIVPESLAVWARQLSVALGEAAWIPRFEGLFRGLQAVAGTLALLGGGGLAEICLIYFVVQSADAGASFLMVSRRCGVALRPGSSRRFLQKLLRHSILPMISVWALRVFLQIGVIIAHFTGGADVAGQVGVALRVLGLFLIAPIVFANVALPEMSHAFDQGDRQGLALPGRVVRFFFAAGGAISILLVYCAPWFVPWLFGENFGGAGRLVTLLGWVVGPLAAAWFAIRTLHTVRSPREAAWIPSAMAGAVVLGAIGGARFIDPAVAVAAAMVAATVLGLTLSALRLNAWTDALAPDIWVGPLLLLASVAAIDRMVTPGPWHLPILGAVFLVGMVLLQLLHPHRRLSPF